MAGQLLGLPRRARKRLERRTFALNPNFFPTRPGHPLRRKNFQRLVFFSKVEPIVFKKLVFFSLSRSKSKGKNFIQFPEQNSTLNIGHLIVRYWIGRCQKIENQKPKQKISDLTFLFSLCLIFTQIIHATQILPKYVLHPHFACQIENVGLEIFLLVEVYAAVVDLV